MQITHPLQYKEKQNESYKNCVCVYVCRLLFSHRNSALLYAYLLVTIPGDN